VYRQGVPLPSTARSFPTAPITTNVYSGGIYNKRSHDAQAPDTGTRRHFGASMDTTFTVDPDTALRAALHERGLACWTEETGGGCQALGVRPAGAGPHPIDAPVVLVTDNDASLPWTSWSATGGHTILAATYEALDADEPASIVVDGPVLPRLGDIDLLASTIARHTLPAVPQPQTARVHHH